MGSFGYCKNFIEHNWSCKFLEGSSSYWPIELTIQSPKVGTNSSFLKESLLFATSHTCQTPKQKLGREIDLLYSGENFEFLVLSLILFWECTSGAREQRDACAHK
jgi:hypothetical protein